MAKREFSAGGIVLKTQREKVKVLLIKDSYGHWTWPKGHIDQEETSREAALREINEEVGLKNLRILAKVGRTNYFFKLNDQLIFKTVFFFLVEAQDKEDLVIQKEEIETAQWFTPEAALKTVCYKGAKEMLEKVLKIYTQEKKC